MFLVTLLAASQPVNQEAASRRVKKQIQQLKAMKCRPTKHKISVKELLSPENELLDLEFWPIVVMVKKCDQRCSYCSSDDSEDIGVEVKSCQPTQTRMKKFHVFHYDQNGQKQYSHFRAEEDKKCGCQIKTANNS